MTSAWLEVLMIITSFCGAKYPGFAYNEQANQCRHQTIQCVRNGALPSKDVVDLLDVCLSNLAAYPVALSTPVPAPALESAPLSKPAKKKSAKK